MPRIGLFVAVCLAASGLAACTDDATTGAAGTKSSAPAKHDTWIVAVGDSYISGEGARWAANTNAGAKLVDALGPRAYADLNGGEREPGCHRASSSEVPIGDGVRAKTLACSGAQTTSYGDKAAFKPGLDFVDRGDGDIGQAAALQAFAADHDVSAVVVSIGGNDFGFGSVVGQCASTFLSTVGQQPQYCADDPEVQQRFTGEQQTLIQNRIVTGIRNLVSAMRQAGHGPEDYQLIVQTYPSPIPPGPRMRYAETIFERGLMGGCPFFSADATWANQTALATINGAVEGAVDDLDLDNASVLDMSTTLDGHRLCEKGVGLFDPREFENWRDEGVADSVEWVNRIYTGSRPWQLQESLHPNYWGFQALRQRLAGVLEGS